MATRNGQERLRADHHRCLDHPLHHQCRERIGERRGLAIRERRLAQYFGLEIAEFLEPGYAAIVQVIIFNLCDDRNAIFLIKGRKSACLDVDRFDQHAVKIENNRVKSCKIHGYHRCRT